MKRQLCGIVFVLALSASVLSFQNLARAQESAGTPAEKSEAGQGDASSSQSDTNNSAQTQSGSQPASGDTPNQADNQSDAGNSSSTQSGSRDASSEEASADINSQSPAATPPQRPGTGAQEQAVQKEATQNPKQADVSLQGKAKSDGRQPQRGHDEFKRGIQFGQITNRGLAISVVEQDSIYFRSGIRRGDVIVSLHGRPVRSQADFLRLIVMYPGQRVPVVILRAGRRHTIYVEYPQDVVHTQPIYDNRTGAAYLGVLFDAKVRDSAMVLRVNRGSPAETAGLRQGDMILAMNGQEIQSYPEVISMIRSMRPGQEVDIVIRRGQSDTQVFAVLGAQANVRTATRPTDIHVEHHALPSDQPADVQIELNRRGNGGLQQRDRSNDDNRDRPLLPRVLD
jgi:hypothetical protein